MPPGVARHSRPVAVSRHVAFRPRPVLRGLGLAITAVLLAGLAVLPSPSTVLAATPMAAACDGVRLRTGPTTSDPTAATINAGSLVNVEATIAGGAWTASCGGASISGSTWHQISELNGQSVSSLFGVAFVYSASGLFVPASPAPTPTPTPTPDPFATPTPTPDPFATPTPSPTPTPTPTPTPFLPTIEGIDVSHWQNTIDWAQVAASGKRFAYMKASEGTDLVDNTYATNRAQARTYGLTIGAYHFARPDRTFGDSIAEADYFLAMSQPTAGDLLPVLDLEVTGGLSPAELQEWAKGYLGRIYERTGSRGVIYSSPTFWRNAMGDTNWFAVNGYRTLWVAHWTSGPTPSIPGENWGGTGWTFWQYSSTGIVPGIGGRVDLDRFNGLDLTPVLMTSGVIAPVAPTLTITPAATVITWGESVVIKAAFGTTGANRLFTLQASSDNIVWQPITTLMTDVSGNASFVYRPATNLFYRGIFDGAVDIGPVTSNTARIVVRQIAVLRPTSNGATKVVPRGRKVTFTTTVRPARTDLPPTRVTFAFYRRVSGRWVHLTDRNGYTNASGQAAYTWTFSSRGEWYVRAIANPTPFNANSAWSPVERYSVR